MPMNIYILSIKIMRTVSIIWHQCVKSIESIMFSGVIIPKFAQTVLLIYLLTTSIARYVKCESDADDCPDPKEIAPCTCDREGLSCFTSITEEDLKRVFQAKSPYNAYRSIWIIDNQGLKKLEKNVINNNRIQNIIIQRNSIEEIEEGAFEGAYKYALKLDLWSNRLKKIPLAEINRMKRLVGVVLSNNMISEIPRGAFQPNTAFEGIQMDHNLLEKIESYTFQGLRRLRILYLPDNKISKIEPDAFAGVPRLGEIILSNNELTKIEARTFQKLPDSVRIVLDGNKISEIEEKAFDRTRISLLDLSNNNLEYLEPKIFGKILQTSAIVNVEGNPFTCQGCTKYAWLLDLGAYQKNLAGFKCKDGRTLQDLTTFNIGCV